MNKSLPTYPEYKPAGLPWLEQVPTHWEVIANRHVFAERKERGYLTEELLSVTIKQGVIKQSDLIKNTSKKDSSNEDKAKYKLVKPGDFAYNKMRMWQGAVGYSDFRGIVSPAYIVLEPIKVIDARYYHHLMRTPEYIKESYRYSYGICDDQLSLRYEDFRVIKTVLPPLAEQQHIVAFLDAKERQVARLLRNKRQLIKLLQEQRQALIHRAVTHGLNPNVLRKDSGVAWLGEVPAHWDVAALRHRYSAELGKMLDEKKITGNFLVPYLRNVDVQWGEINYTGLPAMDISTKEYDRYTVKEGDLLVCEGGDVGRSAFWEGQLEICGFQKALHRVRVLNRSRDSPRYLLYLMLTASKAGVFTADGNENTIPHLTNEKLRAHRFPFPSKEEQERIVRFIDRKKQEIDETISRAQREIELIQEYRTRLIADVVTGRVDVRGLDVPVGGADADLDLTDDEGAVEEELLEETAETDG